MAEAEKISNFSLESQGTGYQKAKDRAFECFSKDYSPELAFWNREHAAHEKDPNYRTLYNGIWWDRLAVQNQLGIAFADVITRQIDLGDHARIALWYLSYRMDLYYLNNPIKR